MRFIIMVMAAALGGAPAFADVTTPKPGCIELLAPAPKPAARRVITVSLNARDFNFNNGAFTKSPRQMKQLTAALLHRDADRIVFQEVVSRAALDELNRRYLGNRYEVYFGEPAGGNVHNIGFLLKKGHGYSVKLQNNRHMMWTDPVDGRERVLFHHDAPALLLFAKGEARVPKLIMIGHHGKSKRDRHGDKESHLMRSAQIRGLRVLVQQYQRLYGADIPIMVLGDFNTDVAVNEKDEMRPFMDMHDVFDLSGIEGRARVTHSYFCTRGRVEHCQLDGIFVTETAAGSVRSAGVDSYREGDSGHLPRTSQERNAQPSDHRPLWVETEEEVVGM